MSLLNPAQVQVIKADRVLQAKVGTGTISEEIISRAQGVMDNNDVDFAPMAKGFLSELGESVEKARGGENMDECVKVMTESVMQLKGNAKTFRYDLIGNLANVMLDFLENVEQLDNDAIEIVGAHHKTLSAIVIKKMTGDGGAYGTQMEEELRSACERYFAKDRG